MKIVLRAFGVLLGLAGLLLGIDQLFFQILGQARLLVSISWLLFGGLFISYGISGKEWWRRVKA